jgi:hypothetical protein
LPLAGEISRRALSQIAAFFENPAAVSNAVTDVPQANRGVPASFPFVVFCSGSTDFARCGKLPKPPSDLACSTEKVTARQTLNDRLSES